MRVLAIDPGDKQSAFVVWNSQKILYKNIDPNEQLRNYFPALDVDRVVIEMVACYGMAVGKTIFDTVLWIGRFYEAFVREGHKPVLVYRLDVKLHHCHTVKAKDSNIRQALIDRFGKPGVKSDPGLTYGLKKDLWQAFALAVYAYDRLG